MRTAFHDGERFYILAPGCDKKIAAQMQESEIRLAFSDESTIRETYKKFGQQEITEIIKYFSEYRKGLLAQLVKNPEIIPKKLKNILKTN